MPVNPRHEAFAQAKGKSADARFYIYELIDPRDGKAFYVGKGCGGRDRSHLAEARNLCTANTNPAKVSRIREIEAAGFQVTVLRIAEGLFEDEAYRRERMRIASYGIANLTNISRGQNTELERAEMEALDGLAIMGGHLRNMLYSGFTKDHCDKVFHLIRQLRADLREIRANLASTAKVAK